MSPPLLLAGGQTVPRTPRGALIGALHTLNEERYCGSNSHQVLGEDLPAHPDWPAFQDAFNHLEPDTCMADGGRYRLRRFGRYRYDVAAAQLMLLPHRPYWQPRYFNPLNGGVDRLFAPLTPAIAGNGVLRAALLQLARGCSALHPSAHEWRINVYFNRIVARAGVCGLPVPEGPHRDGVRFSCLLLADARGYAGGDTRLIDLITHDTVLQRRLASPGDCLVFRDDALLHDTSAIELLPGHTEGRRDMLVIEFDY